jgi:predicted nucleic acid-binding protein
LGLTLDSTVIVARNERGRTHRQLLEAVALEAGDDSIALSVITVLELAHSVARADTMERRERRQRFLDELLIGVSALELGYAVGTGNIRHFQLIQRLEIVRL